MKKFDRSLNGYNVHQVNAFVDDVVDKVDDEDEAKRFGNRPFE